MLAVLLFVCRGCVHGLRPITSYSIKNVFPYTKISLQYSFTGAQGIPKCKMGGGKGWESWENS